MEGFRIDGDQGRTYDIRVEEARGPAEELVRILVDIDLQTFSESTFSTYTAAAFLKHGHVLLLRADAEVIGTCVLMRCWDRPNEVMILSMGIRPGWRGRGLGQQFLAGVIDRVRARGMRAITLLVDGDNRRAVKLYQDVGFEVTETALDDQRTGEALLMLRRRLEPEVVAVLQDAALQNR